MESLVNHQLMMMAPSPIKKKYFDDVIANIFEAKATKKLRLQVGWRHLEVELRNINCMESDSVGKDDNNDARTAQEIRPPARQSLDRTYCCLRDECQFLSFPECGHVECISGERFHHACMVCWVEKRDPNPDCLQWCCRCCVEKYGSSSEAQIPE